MAKLISKIASYGSFCIRESCDPRRIMALRRARSLAHGSFPYQTVPLPGFEDLRPLRPIETRAQDIFNWLEFAPKSLLDIGCNIGHFCFHFARRYPMLNAVGVDSDSSVIAAAKAIAELYHLDSVQFRVHRFASIEDLKLPRSEVVCCLSLLHHIFGLRGREAGLQALSNLKALTLRVLLFEIGAFSEIDDPWARGIRVSLPGGEDELCDLCEDLGFARPIIVGEGMSHLAPVTRRVWAARV